MQAVVDGYARLVVRLRFVIVIGWVAAVVLTTLFLPSIESDSGGALGSLVPKQAGAIAAEERAFELFGVPLLTRTAVVQRVPDGFELEAERRIFQRAIRINEQGYPDLLSVRFALPITNSLGVFPGASERGTTAITYLFFDRDLGLLARDRLARWFTDRRFGPGDGLVGATGAVPARVEQGEKIQEALPLIEGATVILIAVVLGLYYRGPGAPLVAFLGVGISFLVAVRIVPLLGGALDVAVPREVEPLIVVLLLGIVTDYSIFILSGLRNRLDRGEERLEAARAVTRDYTPIIATAGLIVAAGTAALLAGTLEFFRAFGPALALTTLVGLAVALTLVPALVAIGGRAVFWPSLGRPSKLREGLTRSRRGAGRRKRVPELVASRRAAAGVVVIAVALLGAAASGLAFTRLGVAPIEGLPSGSEPREAAAAAEEGFAAGILAPTQLVLEASGIAFRRDSTTELQRLLAQWPHTAAVIGPADQPTSQSFGAVIAPLGDAVRYVLVFDVDPYGGEAVSTLAELRETMPELLEEAGLEGASFSFSGDTALSADTVNVMLDDLKRIALAVLLVNFVLLAVFLRGLVAPLYLLAASVLALAATIGLVTYVFQGLLGGDGLTYYVPFAAAVLLVSLGSDYNILVAGRIWDEARRRPLLEAMAVAIPPASRAITIAGLALAASFALLAIIPLSAFREFAVTMAAGVVIDAFVVRTFLVPALISLVGEVSWWPGRPRSAAPPDAA
jgi:putative drug exporter of the RND superfamily